VRGDVLLAGVAAGAFTDLDQACRAALRPEARFEPDRATAPAYEAAYRRYIELFDTIRPLFRWAERPPLGSEETPSPGPFQR
jgi:ribulose kinase